MTKLLYLLPFIIGLAQAIEPKSWFKPLFSQEAIEISTGQLYLTLPLEFPEDRGPLLFDFKPALQNGQLSFLGKNLTHKFSIQYFSEKQILLWGNLAFSKGSDHYWYPSTPEKIYRIKWSNSDELHLENREGVISIFTKKSDGQWWIAQSHDLLGNKTIVTYHPQTALPSKIHYGFINNIAQHEIRIIQDGQQGLIKEFQLWMRENTSWHLRRSYQLGIQGITRFDHWKGPRKRATLNWLLSKENLIEYLWDSYGNEQNIFYNANQSTISKICSKNPGETSRFSKEGDCTIYQFEKPVKYADHVLSGYEDVTIQQQGTLQFKKFHSQYQNTLVQEWKLDLSSPHLKLKTEYLYEQTNFPLKTIFLSKKKTFYEDLVGKKAAQLEVDFTKHGHCLQQEKKTSSSGTLITLFTYLPSKDFQCFAIVEQKIGTHFNSELDFNETHQWQRDGQTGQILVSLTNGKEIERFTYHSENKRQLIQWQNYKGEYKKFSYNNKGLIEHEQNHQGLSYSRLYWNAIDLIKTEKKSRDSLEQSISWEYDSSERPIKNSISSQWSYVEPTPDQPAVIKQIKNNQVQLFLYSSTGRNIGSSYQNESGTKISNFKHFNPSAREEYTGLDFPLISGKLTYEKLQSWARLSQKSYKKLGVFLPVKKEISYSKNEETITDSFELNIENGLLYSIKNGQDTEVYDAQGFVLKQISGKGKYLISYHDMLGRLKKLEKDNGSVQTFSYDDFNEVSQISHDDFGKLFITRAKNGLIYKKTYQFKDKTYTQTFSYDAQKRVSESIFRDESTMKNSSLRFFYDGKSCTGKQLFNNQSGLLTSICSLEMEISSQYDLENRLIEKQHKNLRQHLNREFFDYDQQNLKSVRWQTGIDQKITSLFFDRFQRPWKIMNSEKETLIQFHYNEFSQASSIDFIPQKETMRTLFDQTGQFALQMIGVGSTKWKETSLEESVLQLFKDDGLPRKMDASQNQILTFSVPGLGQLLVLHQDGEITPTLIVADQKKMISTENLSPFQKEQVQRYFSKISVWDPRWILKHNCQD